MRVRFRRSLSLSAGIGLLAMASSQCVKTPLLAPSGSAITFTEAASSAVAIDPVTISVLVQEAGPSTTGQNGQTQQTVGGGQYVHDGTLVTFTSTTGTMDPFQARTVRGRATVTFTGDGRTGKTTITASSGPATKTHDINLTAPPPETARIVR